MKKVLLLMTMALLVSSVAMADHIAVYVDDQGINCNLASGVTTTATVVYKGWTPGGSTGARFKISPPAGTVIFGFTTQYVTIGTIDVDLSIAYGSCVEGNFPIGTIAASWAAGNGAIVAPDPFPFIMTDCSFGEYPITGGTFCVAAPGDCECSEPNATQPSTWGKVKSLYR